MTTTKEETAIVSKIIMKETQVSREDVLLHFLIMEGKMEEILLSYLKWEVLKLDGNENTNTPLHSYINSRKDINPALVYLIGVGNDKHCNNVSSWNLKKISTADIYSCGINENVNDDLNNVKGNLKDFALNHADKYPEFTLHNTNNIPRRESIIIVVKQKTDDKKGSYELLDGAHRLINMCRQGEKEVWAFVANMKNKG